MSHDSEDPDRQVTVRRMRHGTGKVRLRDVADLAGVSTATVSRSFNEPDKVTETIRQKVLAAASTLNWIPNAAGRALATSRTKIFGAIIPTLDNEIFANQISGMQAVLAQKGFSLFLGSTGYDPAESLRHVRAMLSRGIEALALVGEDHPSEVFALLRKAGIPYVVTYAYSAKSIHPCIGFDNRAAFDRITQHLIDLGHRRIAAIFQPRTNNDRVAARLCGIDDALERAGMTLTADRLCIGSSSMTFGGDAFRKLMGAAVSERPTAVICGNDTLALGALFAAKRQGIHVPNECSITGFDDLAISSVISPSLMTMHVDNTQIGILSAKHLLSILSKGSMFPIQHDVGVRLQVRESTAILTM